LLQDGRTASGVSHALNSRISTEAGAQKFDHPVAHHPHHDGADRLAALTAVRPERAARYQPNGPNGALVDARAASIARGRGNKRLREEEPPDEVAAEGDRCDEQVLWQVDKRAQIAAAIVIPGIYLDGLDANAREVDRFRSLVAFPPGLDHPSCDVAGVAGARKEEHPEHVFALSADASHHLMDAVDFALRHQRADQAPPSSSRRAKLSPNATPPDRNSANHAPCLTGRSRRRIHQVRELVSQQEVRGPNPASSGFRV
jgi:hypothetical protein